MKRLIFNKKIKHYDIGIEESVKLKWIGKYIITEPSLLYKLYLKIFK